MFVLIELTYCNCVSQAFFCKTAVVTLAWHYLRLVLSFQSYYFSRADVSLPGFAKFFSEASKEERTHAEKMMEYINSRGGEVELADVKVKLNLQEFSA